MCGIFGFILHNENFYKKDLSFRKNIMKKFCNFQHRGPDNSVFKNINKKIIFGFHRLAIMDTSSNGDQPFCNNGIYLICNGEIYNHKQLIKENDFKMKSSSDCEVIIHMYNKYGIEKTINNLDGVFAFILFDVKKNKLFVGRDPIGVRSLYQFYNNEYMCFSSEMKGMNSKYCRNVSLFPPGSYLELDNNKSDYKIKRYYNQFDKWLKFNVQKYDYHKTQIRKIFTEAVNKRLMSDRPVGCLLSGGLDSSLVTALVAKQFTKDNPLHTFSIGMEGATDIKYARMVANHIGSKHHEIIVSEKNMLSVIEKVIYNIESWDTTTVRASIPMVLMCEYIKQNTDITVIYSGEGSDEASGSYMYFHNAPNDNEFHKETIRLIKDLQYFDVLRCDKSIASAGLEVRVPFLDKKFLDYYMTIEPKFKRPIKGIEKYLLRDSFEGTGLLPKEVLWRTKEAFSDGCSTNKRSWYSILQEHINNKFSDLNLTYNKILYPTNTPKTKEALYYRNIFNKYYTNEDKTIPYYWLPKWSGNINEPSARVLTAYKKHK